MNGFWDLERTDESEFIGHNSDSERGQQIGQEGKLGNPHFFGAFQGLPSHIQTRLSWGRSKILKFCKKEIKNCFI